MPFVAINPGELVAVYGSLRNGLGNHRRLETAVRQDDGIIRDQFYMVSLGGFPALFKPIEGQDATDIVVEVYEVEDEQRARSLDALEGHHGSEHDLYHREKVTLVDGRTCWVYFMTRDSYRASPFVESGDWYKYCKEP